jgi:hypothetical protein
VLTKSSSASDFRVPSTVLVPQDEGLSVDDAIGMYEVGFTDDVDAVDTADGSNSPKEDRWRLVETPQPHDRGGSGQDWNSERNDAQEPGMGKTPQDLGSPASREMRSSASIVSGRVCMAQDKVQPLVAETTTRDRYGFRKATQHVTQAQFDAWNGPYTEYLDRRRKKWIGLMKESGLPTDDPGQFPAKSSKVKRFVRKGIPPDWRGAAWFWYGGGGGIMDKNKGLYQQLVEKAEKGEMSEVDREHIERDLNRTFPDNVKFKPDLVADSAVQNHSVGETSTVSTLRRVLCAFSIQNPRIGYCQSLNFLAGLLILFMEEEKAFWMLNIITHVYLPGTHEVNLEGANVDLGVLMTSIKESMPTVWAKVGGELDATTNNSRMSMRLPPITLCTTAWFMSCFIGTLPIETVLRVWDSFFYEGSKTLFRIALAIFKVGEQEIRAVNDPMEIFQVVQTIPRRLIDANLLMDACFKRRNGFGHISQETIEERRAERRRGYAEERARVSGDILPKTSLKRSDTRGRFLMKNFRR